MKKIQITTIQKTANIEVIELNSAFVAQAVRAAVEAENLKSDILSSATMRVKRDAEGEAIKDENGKEVREFDFEHGCEPHICNPEAVINNLIGFVLKLEAALLGEEK